MSKTCDICGCSDPKRKIFFNQEFQMTLCSKHYHQLHRYGTITDASSFSRFDNNEIEIQGDHATMMLRNAKHQITGTALIDIEDIPKCQQYKWHLTRNGYVGTQTKNGYAHDTPKDRKNILLHRYLLDYNDELDIDHINHNKLDNRKANLRIVSKCINASNNQRNGIRKPYSEHKQWVPIIQRYGKQYIVGYFKTEKEAQEARRIKKQWLDEHDDELRKEYLQTKEQLPTGISKSPFGSYQAYFYIHVGSYKTKEEAIEARTAAIANYQNTHPQTV